jgi:hypothetical protein
MQGNDIGNVGVLTAQTITTFPGGHLDIQGNVDLNCFNISNADVMIVDTLEGKTNGNLNIEFDTDKKNIGVYKSLSPKKV